MSLPVQRRPILRGAHFELGRSWDECLSTVREAIL